MKAEFQNTVTGSFLPVHPKPMREILSETRLSRLPSLSKPGADICANCKIKLTSDNQPLSQAQACRKCLAVYSVIDSALNESTERKARNAKLAKMQRKLSFQK